ncbi:MAG: hypothetical protein K8S18_04945 [Desulfobacula sp.]|nr:hypothetical protein [Desulfobacula sp.]
MIEKLKKWLGLGSSFKVGGVFEVVCYGPDGKEKWRDTAKNLVPDTALNHILDVILHGTTAIGTWYVGLKNTGSPAAADTLASHAGWTENSNYADNRKEYVEAAASGKSITNSANKASFAINTDSQTIAGAFLCSVATGTTGTLLCAADFTGGNKSVDNGDTLEVTYTISAADA